MIKPEKIDKGKYYRLDDPSYIDPVDKNEDAKTDLRILLQSYPDIAALRYHMFSKNQNTGPVFHLYQTKLLDKLPEKDPENSLLQMHCFIEDLIDCYYQYSMGLCDNEAMEFTNNRLIPALEDLPEDPEKLWEWMEKQYGFEARMRRGENE